MTRYWFARYRLPPNSSRGLVPLGWEGRAVIAAFAVAMIGGGLLFIGLSFAGAMAWGVALFVICAIAGASFFLWAAMTKSDPSKTVADYRSAGMLK